MLRPSYNQIINKVNERNTDVGIEAIDSRFSIIVAIAKRARQIIDGDEVLVKANIEKPLSTAVKEVFEGQIGILPWVEEK